MKRVELLKDQRGADLLGCGDPRVWFRAGTLGTVLREPGDGTVFVDFDEVEVLDRVGDQDWWVIEDEVRFIELIEEG